MLRFIRAALPFIATAALIGCRHAPEPVREPVKPRAEVPPVSRSNQSLNPARTVASGEIVPAQKPEPIQHEPHESIETPIPSPRAWSIRRVHLPPGSAYEPYSAEAVTPETFRGKLVAGAYDTGALDDRIAVQIQRIQQEPRRYVYYSLWNYGSLPVEIIGLEHVVFSRPPGGGGPIAVAAARVSRSAGAQSLIRIEPNERFEVRAFVKSARYIDNLAVRVVYSDQVEAAFSIFGLLQWRP